MKKFGFSLLAVIALYGNQTSMPVQPPQQQMPQPTPIQPLQGIDCSELTPDEEQFASRLNQVNQILFCGSFNVDQRSAAVEMTHQGLLPDQAVQKVALDNAIPIPQMAPKPPNPQHSGGGCPIR